MFVANCLALQTSGLVAPASCSAALSGIHSPGGALFSSVAPSLIALVFVAASRGVVRSTLEALDEGELGRRGSF